MKLFGFTFGKSEEERKEATIPSIVPPTTDGAAIDLASGNFYGSFLEMDTNIKSDIDLITKYRNIALQAEVELAVDEIVNEAIVHQERESSVKLNLDQLNLDEEIKKKIQQEFKNILNLLDFDNLGHDIFRRWYVDGRLYYHIMINEKNPSDGIRELRYIDPRRIRKVRETIKQQQDADKPVNNITPNLPKFVEYYMYNHTGIQAVATGISNGIKIAKESISFTHSGIFDSSNRHILSYLHKAMKPANQLNMLEDASVIYALSRAPERRIFYIDVGTLPKIKAEQYLKDMMTRHKNKLVYDASTGEIKDSRKFMTMLEDYWLPRREGNKGTEITNLPGGQQLGETEHLEYFREKLYKALGVPMARVRGDSLFNTGRAGEITREEIKFAKIIARLRNKFSMLFDNLLRAQLILTGVINKDDWKKIKEFIHYDFITDSYYAESKEQDIMVSRLNIVQMMDPFVGKYFSTTFVKKNILKMTEEDVKTMKKEIENDAKDGHGGMGPDATLDPNQNPFDPALSTVPPIGGFPQPADKKPAAKKPTPAKPKPKKELLVDEVLNSILESK